MRMSSVASQKFGIAPKMVAKKVITESHDRLRRGVDAKCCPCRGAGHDAFFGQATPILGGVIPKWNWGYADIHFFQESSDLGQAKKLLAEAGYPDGFDTS